MITHQIPVGTAGGNSGGYEHKAAETVLQDVRVIAIDQRLESKAGEAVVAHTATLEVTPKQTEMIALAGEIGKLSLNLRSLVPAASDAATSADPATATEASAATDSSGGSRGPTYTVDSEISPLLPKSLRGTDNSDNGLVTILRGGGKGSESTASQPASRGS